MYLTQSELQSHIYPEVSAEISRGNTQYLDDAIKAATEEARGYIIARYNADVEFARTGVDRNPLLLFYVKDLAKWHFIVLANPNIDLVVSKERYDRAVKWLQEVQRGIVMPLLPEYAPDAEGNRQDSGVQWMSNPQRTTNPPNF